MRLNPAGDLGIGHLSGKSFYEALGYGPWAAFGGGLRAVECLRRRRFAADPYGGSAFLLGHCPASGRGKALFAMLLKRLLEDLWSGCSRLLPSPDRCRVCAAAVKKGGAEQSIKKREAVVYG